MSNASLSLFSAVRRGDTGTVRALLFPGETFDETAEDGTGLPPTALVALSALSALSSSLPRGTSNNNNNAGSNNSNSIGVNPNHVDKASGTVALHQAVSRGDTSLAALLLRHPATSPSVKDAESGWTPMHAAVYNGDVAMARLLTRAGGASPTERDKEGNSWADLLNSTYEGAKPRSRKQQQQQQQGASKSGAGKPNAPSGVRPLLPPTTKFLAPSATTTPNHSGDEDSDTDDDDGRGSHRSDSEFASLSSSPPRGGGGKKRRHGSSLSEIPPAASVWTWGTNHNFVLGHPTPDSRAFPERLPPLPTNPPITLDSLQHHLPGIKEAKMAKYHSAIVTDDGRLFVHGFGSGGRLGLGAEVNASVLRPTQVPLSDVRTVALGNNHTLVVTNQGQLLSFGSNSSGQLGYATNLIPGTSGEMGPEWSPREVMKRGVVGVAAGKEHSVCWTENGAVYSWGKNLGMLGHPNVAANAIITTPRKITSFHSPHILQVECTAAATAILHAPTPQERQVVVFSADNVATRVLFPVANPFPRSFSLYTSSTQLEQQRRHNNTRMHRIVRLAAGNGQFAALTSAGEVFLWTPPGERADTWFHSTFPQSKPKRIWAVRNRAWLAARDVAVGLDSSILVATRSGHVYKGTRREKAKQRAPSSNKQTSDSGDSDLVYFKFGMVPGLQHVTRVAASGSGGFAAIRVDDRPGGSWDVDIGRLRRELGMLVDGGEGDGFDLVFELEDSGMLGGQVVKAHRCVLAARSPFLKKLFVDAEHQLEVGASLSVEGIQVTRLRDEAVEDEMMDDDSSQAWKLTIEGVHSQSIVPLLQFAYSASFVKTWDHTAFSPSGDRGKRENTGSHSSGSKKKGNANGPTPATIYADFRKLVKLFGLGDPDAVQFSQEQGKISKAFGKDLMSLVDFSGKVGAVLSDTVLRLEDREVEVHRVVLVTRSPFFEAMLGGGGARWALQKDEEGRVVVALDHLRWDVVKIVLAWMYGDLDAAELFGDVAKSSVQELDDFVVEVLSAATELLLPQLKDVCCSILVRTLDLRTVNGLLETADMFDAEGLKDACLDFVCWNLETFLESRMLEDVGPELLEDISERLRQMQSEKYPFIRGEDGYYAQIRREAARVEEERKQRRRIDFGERKKLEELSRSLDDSTISMLIANGAFDPQPGATTSSTGRGGGGESSDDDHEPPPVRKNGMHRSISGGSGGARGDDDIFELEIEDSGRPGSSSGSSAWGKTGSVQPAPLPSSGRQAPPSPRPEPPVTPTSKRIAKPSWKKVDLNTGKVLDLEEQRKAQEQQQQQAGGLVGSGTPQASPAAPKTWSVPVQKTNSKPSLIEIMNATASSSSPKGAPRTMTRSSSITSPVGTPISSSLQSNPSRPPPGTTPPSGSGGPTTSSGPRIIKSNTWTASPSNSIPTSPMASPPPSAMLAQQAHMNAQTPPSLATLSLGSMATLVSTSGSQKDRRKSSKNRPPGSSPVLGPTVIGVPSPSSSSKGWKGWAPVETPAPVPLMLTPPQPSPAENAARLRDFPAISNTPAKEPVQKERIWW